LWAEVLKQQFTGCYNLQCNRGVACRVL